MEVEALLPRFAVALGIGLLIGIERGWRSREETPGSRTAGIRTFAITGVLGGLVGALAMAIGGPTGSGRGLVVGLSLAAYAGVITLFCLEENRADHSYSATTAIASIATFALGIYALLGEIRVASAVTVAMAVLLAMRESIHGWVKAMTWPELRSGLILLAMTFIALPIVPDDPVGPFGGVNLREVWLIAIVLAGVSFLGYAAVKYFGERHGVLLAAAAGGLVSSTAVTFANARRAAIGEGSPRVLVAGVALATAVSFLRVLGILAALRPGLLALVAPPLLAATVVAVGCALWWGYRGQSKDAHQTAVALRNPFGFWTVIGFALAMGVIILLGRFLDQSFGSSGAIMGAAALGLFDVDAVTVSMTRLVPQPLSVLDGAYAILAAVASNTLSKLVMGAVLGRGPFAIAIALLSVACAAASLGGLWLAFLAFSSP